MPPTDVEELKDIFREHGDSNSLAMRDVPANTELSQVMCLLFDYRLFYEELQGTGQNPKNDLGASKGIGGAPETGATFK